MSYAIPDFITTGHAFLTPHGAEQEKYKDSEYRVYLISSEEVKKLKQQGFEQKNLAQKKIVAGGIYSKERFSQKSDCTDRVFRLGLCCIASTACFCCLPCLCFCDDSQQLRDDWFIHPLLGEDCFECYVKDQEQTSKILDESLKKIGCNGRDAASLKTFAEQNPTRIVQIQPYQHAYIPLQLDCGISAIIFLPYGKTDNISFHTVYNQVNGIQLNSQKIHNFGIKFAMCYEPNLPKHTIITSPNEKTPFLNPKMTKL